MSTLTENKTRSSISGKISRFLWIVTLAIGLWFLLSRAIPYFNFADSTYGRFWPIKWWVLGHVVGGTLALIIGPFQFAEGFRVKYMSVHRNMGKIYLSAILIGAICSFVMAGTTAIEVSFAWAAGLASLGIAWLVTAGMAYRSVLMKRIDLHKEWMIRSYVVTFGFVTFRLFTDIAMIFELGTFPEVAPTIGWACWVIPLLFTEVILDWNKS